MLPGHIFKEGKSMKSEKIVSVLKKFIKGNKGATIGNICDDMGVELPAKFRKLKNKKVTKTTLTDKYIIPGSVFFMLGHPRRYKRLLNHAMENEAILVFADRHSFDKTKLDANDYPLILLDNATEKIGKIYDKYRNEFNGVVIGITGSLGKTTTRQYIDCILGDVKKYVSVENANSMNVTAMSVPEKMNNSVDYYVQEVGAGGLDTVDMASSILKPDISVITNVKAHHLSAYETLENVFNDKIKLAENMCESGVAVVNFDDKGLAGYEYKCDVISFGIECDKEVDYRGVNIKQVKDLLSMDIIHRGEITHIESSIYGIHNAYNILAAFAVGKKLNIDEKQMVDRIRNYRTEGIRQNVKVFGSNTFFMDCYNVSNDSIINALKAFEHYEVPETARKIAILGGENKLGIKNRTELTKELGVAIKDSNVSEIVCFGSEDQSNDALNHYGDALTLHKTLIENGFENTKYIDSFDGLCEYLGSEVKSGDAVLCKCIYWLNVAAAVDKVFGTNFSVDLKYIKQLSDTVKSPEFKFRNILMTNCLQIIGASLKTKNSSEVVIPNEVENMPILGIKEGLFKNNKTIEMIDFGTTLKTIGISAFENCTNLKNVTMSDSVTVIMDRAFAGCVSLKEVRLGRGVKHIGKNAFVGCENLETVYMPKSVENVENSAIETKIIIKYYG